MDLEGFVPIEDELPPWLIRFKCKTTRNSVMLKDTLTDLGICGEIYMRAKLEGKPLTVPKGKPMRQPLMDINRSCW